MEQIIVTGSFGLSGVAVIYFLIAHARRAGLLVSTKATFLAVGVLALVVVSAFAVSMPTKPSVGVFLMLWAGLWVAAIQFKSAVKDNEAGKSFDKTQG